MPASSIRHITLTHAQQMQDQQEAALGQVSGEPKACIISETDGSMVPIVENGLAAEDTSASQTEEKPDRRRTKSLIYKEAKLTLAHAKGSTTPVYSATMGSAEEAGKHVLHCIKAVGLGKDTHVHCVGDGALWIANRIDEQLGRQARYLVDFYHLCDYLSGAAGVCAGKEKTAWLSQQKQRLKTNRVNEVLLALSAHIEPASITQEEEAPVRACHRYITNRRHQLDYETALKEELPIGSGEIESAHRYVIQQRLKLAGAWWTQANATKMLALRTIRANEQWETYWKRNKAA